MNTLRELYYGKGYDYYPTDKGTTHRYIDIYDQLLLPYKDRKINVLEVGVSEGGSIKLWSEYFTQAHITGIDIVKSARQGIFDDCKNITYVIEDIKNIKRTDFDYAHFTIAIDDGSHELQDQLLFVQLFYPNIAQGGMLIIEDIQDINNQLPYFKGLGLPFEIIDLRNIQGRYDDVLLIFRKDIPYY